jgi:hypothetical protein
VTSKSATPRGPRFSLPFHPLFLSSSSPSLLTRQIPFPFRSDTPALSSPSKDLVPPEGETVNWGKRLLVLGREEDVRTLRAHASVCVGACAHEDARVRACMNVPCMCVRECFFSDARVCRCVTSKEEEVPRRRSFVAVTAKSRPRPRALL